jgi:hypothetical protein
MPRGTGFRWPTSTLAVRIADRRFMTSGIGRMIVFGLVYLAATEGMRAADIRTTWTGKPLDIAIRPRGFGKASSADIHAVIQSAARELWRHCRHTQLAAIDVYHRADHPQTDFKTVLGGRITIGLSAQDTHWAQYSFQFAHEFCHALANYSNGARPLVRYPGHANLWLEESLCETASLFTLRAMGSSWQNDPPHPAWREYAVWLNSYAEKRLALAKHHLRPGTQFSIWFRENQSVLRHNPTERSRNTIIATQLLPIFEAEPRGWEALAFLNCASIDPKSSLAQHLAKWHSRCPQELRSFVTKVAAVFL